MWTFGQKQSDVSIVRYIGKRIKITKRIQCDNEKLADLPSSRARHAFMNIQQTKAYKQN